MTNTEVKDVAVITAGLTTQQLLEHVNMLLSVVAGVFTAIYAFSTCTYAIIKLKDYLQQRKENKHGKHN